MKTLNISIRILLVGVLSLTLNSCADSFDTPAGPTGPSIAAKMAADANFNLWTAAAQRVGIYPSLNNNNSGMVTIFAPSDPAMTTYLGTIYAAQLPLPITEASLIAFIDGLSTTSNPTLASFTGTLVPVMNYHMVSSVLTSTMLTGTQTFATINGARLSISRTGSTVVLNGNSATNGATIASFDLMGSNGVAHTIDRVMTALSTATVLTPGLSISYATNPPTITGYGVVGDVDASDTDFDLMYTLIRWTGQTPTILPNTTPLPDFTIFRANDGLIRAYLLSLNATLTTEALCFTFISTASASTTPTLAELTAFTQYFIVPGRYLSNDLTDGQELQTLLPSAKITVDVAPGPPPVYTLGDLNAATDPTISAANSLTNSGVLHTISAVLRNN